MAVPPYTKRYGAGFVDGSGGGTPEDSAFLNAVESALLFLLGEVPTADEVGVYSTGLSRLVYQKITNAQIDPAAAIAKSKLAALNITDADIAGGAAIAKAKLAALAIVNADIDAAAAIAITKLAGYPSDASKVLKGDGTWAVPSSIGYGIALPGSPTDGQEYILVDSLTVPTYQWRFRWNNSSANADKWECLGAVPAIVEVATSETTASTSYVALATGGPSFTVPRAGVYDVTIEATIEASAGDAAHMSYDIGGTGALDADSVQRGINSAGAADEGVSVHGTRRKSGLAASTALVSKYRGALGGTMTFKKRRIIVTPVRVS